jgi:O-antigen/teichoic acid export membrane protein
VSSSTAEIARGAGATFLGYGGKLARPIAYALFARVYGLDALGIALLVYAWVEIASRIAGLGLDRALQRFVPGVREQERPAVVARALVATAAASVIVATALAAVLPAMLRVDGVDALAVRLAALVMLPALTVGSTALHAVRGTKQVLALVWARSVIEPGVFLAAGVLLAPFIGGLAAVLAAFAVSTIAVLVAGVAALSRTFGLRKLVRARGAAGVGLGELLRFAIPLGLADLANLALQRGDVVAISVTLQSPALTSGYAIAREVVTSLSKVRQGFDQVLAPVAAELHASGKHGELAQVARLSARWGSAIAAPIALVLIVFPETVLSLFDIHDTGIAAALAILAVGRFVDVATGPTSVLLAMIGRPRLVLLDAVVGLAVALLAAGPLAERMGVAGIALATGAGLVLTNLMTLYWLDRLAHMRPLDDAFAQPLAAFGVGALALLAVRIAFGSALTPALLIGFGIWLASYFALAIGLGLLPSAWRPRRALTLEAMS